MKLYINENPAGISIWDDTTTANVVYVGYIAPNPNASLKTQVAIKRIDLSNKEVKWADGNQNFDNIWANRVSLDYAEQNTI